MNAVAATSPSISPINLAAKRAALLMGCYRKADLIDPEIFTRAAISVLVRYPESVVLAVTEPATGIPSKLKWFPNIAEITDACELEMGPIVRQRVRDRIAAEQLCLAAPASGPKMTVEEMEARLGRKLGSFLRKA